MAASTGFKPVVTTCVYSIVDHTATAFHHSVTILPLISDVVTFILAWYDTVFCYLARGRQFRPCLGRLVTLTVTARYRCGISMTDGTF